MEYNWPTFVDDLEAGWLTSDAAKNDNKDDPAEWPEDAHNAAITLNIRLDAAPLLIRLTMTASLPLSADNLVSPAFGSRGI